MTDVVKALAGGLWRFVYAWILPTAMVAGVFVVVVFPVTLDLPWVGDLASRVARQPLGTRVAIFTSSIVALAILLALNSAPLYRLLEGYSWPRWAFERGRKTQIDRWRKLHKRITQAAAEKVSLPRRQILQERYSQLPRKADYFLPTRLGNALKALETYASHRYGFDSQTFWYELQAIAPDQLRKDIEIASSVVDFFVGLLYLAALFAVVALGVGIAAGDAGSIVAGFVAVGGVPFFYWRAVRSAGESQAAVQALVNTGRFKLAEMFRLQVPATLKQEQEMWQALTDFVAWGGRKSRATLDLYHATTASAASSECNKPADGEVVLEGSIRLWVASNWPPASQGHTSADEARLAQPDSTPVSRPDRDETSAQEDKRTSLG